MVGVGVEREYLDFEAEVGAEVLAVIILLSCSVAVVVLLSCSVVVVVAVAVAYSEQTSWQN